MEEITNEFGLHLMLDGYNCPAEILNDANKIYEFLDQMPEKIGMKKLTKPYIVKAVGNDKKDPGGWTGFVIIEESHISVHTFVKRGFITIDAYSCKHFDKDMAVSYIKEFFQVKEAEIHVEVRGKKYPSENIY